MLTKEPSLESISYFPSKKAVNVAWKHSYYEDGKLIEEKIHRGAFAVNDDGEVDEEAEKVLGEKLSDILGKAAKDAIATRKGSDEQYARLAEHYDAAYEANEQLKVMLTAANAENEQLKEKAKNIESLNEVIQEEKRKLKDQLTNMTLAHDVLVAKVEELEQAKTEKPTKK